MRKITTFIAAAAFAGVLAGAGVLAYSMSSPEADESREGEAVDELVPAPADEAGLPSADPLADWRRPDGPVRIVLQAGHWKSSEAPDEQENLRFNNGVGNGYSEWKVNLAIAEETRSLLLAAHPEYQVEILPVTVPPDEYADVFVAIHADSNPNRATRGYKAASPRRDRTGNADRLAAVLAREYAAATGLPRDPTLTSNMRGYYAFNWCKYEHSLHPMTAGALLETGFLTNAGDIQVIGRDPALAARGVANGILAYLDGGTATPDEVSAVSTVPEWLRDEERKRAADKRDYERRHGIVNPADLIAPNANRPDDPWCQPTRRAGISPN